MVREYFQYEAKLFYERRRRRDWVSLHHGGGVGMGYSQHSGAVIVCDGSPEGDKRITRVLWSDPSTGVMRHADAGYANGKDCAREMGLKLPMAPHSP